MKCPKCQLANAEDGPVTGIMKKKNRRERNQGVGPNYFTTYTS